MCGERESKQEKLVCYESVLDCVGGSFGRGSVECRDSDRKTIRVRLARQRWVDFVYACSAGEPWTMILRLHDDCFSTDSVNEKHLA